MFKDLLHQACIKTGRTLSLSLALLSVFVSPARALEVGADTDCSHRLWPVSPIANEATVELRPVVASDLPYLRGLFSDERVFPTFYWPGFKITDKTMAALLGSDFDAIEQDPLSKKWSFFSWVITIPGTGEPAGYVEINRLSKKEAEKYLGSPQKRGLVWASRGIAIDPKMQGRGIATAALSAVIRFGFQKLRIDGFLSSTAYDNASMGKVITKVGGVKLREDVPIYDDTEVGDNVYVVYPPSVPKTDDRYFFSHVSFPPIAQQTDVTCGPACGRSLLIGLGLPDVSEKDLAAAMKTGKVTEGTPPRLLAAGLEGAGAIATVREGMGLADIDHALEMKHGVLALVTDLDGIPHWILVTGSNATDFRQMDPWDARTSPVPPVQSRSEFEHSWHGESDREYQHLFIEVSKPSKSAP